MRLNSCYLFSPFRCFWYAILMSKDIVLPFVETHSVRINVILIVTPCNDPLVGNRCGHGRIRSRPDGDPFISLCCSGIVAIGRDEYHLLPQLLKPEKPLRLILPTDETGLFHIV